MACILMQTTCSDAVCGMVHVSCEHREAMPVPSGSLLVLLRAGFIGIFASSNAAFVLNLQLLGHMLCRVPPAEFWLNTAKQSTGYFSLQ